MYIQVKILIFLLILCESQLTISTAQTIDEESNDSIEITANESEDWPNHIGRHLKESYRLKESLSAAIQSLSQDIDDEIDNTDNPLGETNLKSLFVKYDTDDGNTCLLDSIKQDILWWVYPNGTLRTTNARFSTHRYLDLSHGNISKDLDLLFKSKFGGRLNFSKVQAFSAAYNNLNAAPYITLSSMKGSLKYLSLQGNQFSAINADAEEESIAWAKFPNMPQLLELDVSNCSIEYLTREAFRNVTNLRKLFISNNKIMTLEADTFYHIQGLQYLDLSFTNVLNYNYQFSMPTLEVILNLVYGLKIYQTVFKMLPELVYLDLSHSKITRNSAVAFTHLGSKLKYLSLCYTSFPMVSNGLFKNTALEGLDLSGNSFVSYNIVDDAFDGIGDTLKCLYFEHSNLGDLSWSKPLRNLLVLGLAGNNINALSSDVFESLVSLKVLDLSSNHIGNWYKSVFRNNSSLRVLNLRSNNINMLSTEMLKDFENLEYLSLGDNNFICNCMLREVVEVAANNNKQANCSYEVLEDSARDLLFNRTNWSQLSKLFYKQFERDFWDSRIIPLLTDSYKNIKEFKQLNKIRKLHFVTSDLKTRTCPSSTTKTFNDTSLKFQLLDYEATNYWCFNETDQIQVDQLNCQVRAMADLELQIHNTVMIITAVIGSILGASILGFIIYLKRWHIHYYYASLKSAALLSRASKESLDKFHHLTEHDPNMVYDIFISYCQNDRPWVLEELLPNVEKSGDISICLHERDFQIGVTILDNIISCMDRSRSLMLLISSKFLLSHWCQFEMYLAQHRIFEVSKEHLILVFLEDIPRRKRPKTLQYLMDIKTYIKWPSKAGKQPSTEERKLFWKRLRKSLEYIGIGTKDSKA
ncbi:toll-like receptor 4 isoform X2 [Drosophila albomicans]|uniref:Toll-like receptor 4 isoform X2 n=1 Tax=Drosophila albomicans TaxID=7291 RepID=A0A6P8X3V2_DROAB|nr:toll-like receptor 4 isoform X2 [Drosophila albomicans]